MHVTVDGGKKLSACIVPVCLDLHRVLWVVELTGNDWVIGILLLINRVCVVR